VSKNIASHVKGGEGKKNLKSERKKKKGISFGAGGRETSRKKTEEKVTPRKTKPLTPSSQKSLNEVERKNMNSVLERKTREKEMEMGENRTTFCERGG